MQSERNSTTATAAASPPAAPAASLSPPGLVGGTTRCRAQLPALHPWWGALRCEPKGFAGNRCFDGTHRQAHARDRSTQRIPSPLRLDPFNDWGGGGRHTCPDDIDLPHRGADPPFVGLHVHALQGRHLPMNGGLDAGGTRRGRGIIEDRGGDPPQVQGPVEFEDPEVKRHPVRGDLLVGGAIDQLLQVAQRFGLLGADFPQSPDGGHRVGGDDLTAVIDAQLVLDFIGVFIALNDKQVEVCAPPRQREQQQGEEGQSEAWHTLLLGSTRARVAGRAPGGGHPGAMAAWLGGPLRATALYLRKHYTPGAPGAQGCCDGTHMQAPLRQEAFSPYSRVAKNP